MAPSSRAVAAAALLAVLAAAGSFLALRFAPAPAPRLAVHPVTYADLPGWKDDDLSTLWPVFIAACARLEKREPQRGMGGAPIYGAVRDWLPVCGAAQANPPNAARAFFEHWFTPVAVLEGRADRGLFTGYYEAEAKGALFRHGRFQTPLRRRPDDLISVELGDFVPELKGRRTAGRRIGNDLKPYPDRAAIEAGALEGEGLEFVWLDDPIDAFFIEIQGSGRISLEDGSELRVSYAAQNGQAYTALGKELIRRGALQRGSVTMAAIRSYLATHPDQIAELLDTNRSYVFFREAAAVGAAGASLTPLRSLAVDRAFHPLDIPMFVAVDAAPADRPGVKSEFRRLVISEDTGGAIRGIVRGDIFWGAGAEAAATAGEMQNSGRLYALLPAALIHQ